MWKQFKYKKRERVAWVAPEGPAYQVLDAGKPVSGFRAFKKEGMSEVEKATPRPELIEDFDLEAYPELGLALLTK